MVSPIPAVVAATSLGFLAQTGQLSYLIEAFFENLDVLEQICLLALLFSVIYIAVSISAFVDVGNDTGGGHSHDHEEGDIFAAYPFEEMQLADNERDKFLALFPSLRDEILGHMLSNGLPTESAEWCREMIDYNVSGGILNNGMAVVNIYRIIIDSKRGRRLTFIEDARACVLGWAVEFLQTFFVVADDVMNDGRTRRGKPCWHELPKVQMIATNDSLMLESFVFTIIRTHFHDEPYYPHLVELFMETIQQRVFGNQLDLASQPIGLKGVDLTRFTVDRFRLIVKHKTAIDSFYLPVAIGMIASGIKDKKAYESAKRICCGLGEYFQVQDDYLDCFGDTETIGKVGTDIQDGKCSWLVVQTLEQCSTSQRVTLENNYGQSDDKKVARVKELYEELQIKEIYTAYEKDQYRNIQEEMQKIGNIVPREVFDSFMKMHKKPTN